MSNKIKITIQGISRDLSTANGDYDGFEMDLVSPDELMDLLGKIRHLELPIKGPDDDLCPPHIVVDRTDGIISFIMEGGNIFCIEKDEYVAPQQAVDLATGKTKVPPVENNPSEPAPTNFNGPLISHSVWKSNDKRETALTFLALGSVFLVPPGIILMIVEGVQSLNAALLLILFGVASIGLYFLLGKRGHEQYRLGFDWDTNTMWIDRKSAGEMKYVPCANMIIDFSMQKVDTNMEITPYFVGDSMYVTGGKEREWGLLLHKADTSQPLWVMNSMFATKSEATAVLKKARSLLQMSS